MRDRDATPRNRQVPSPPSRGPVLQAASTSKRFGGAVALREVDFDLNPGEIHAPMGKNGAGESTLMKILSGVYTEYEGAVSVDGEIRRFAGVRDAEAAGTTTPC
jgi:ribose transport system ATP-binding protein